MAGGDGAETVRKLIVEVVEARDLLPKDGVGTCSSYAVVDFNGQRKRTQTVHRSLNPSWNETLEFDVEGMEDDTDGGGRQLEVDVLHDKRVGPSRIRNNFLGRLRLDSEQHFVKKGEEALIHFPLQRKSFFSWVRGNIGLKIYYLDVPVAVTAPDPVPPPPPPEPEKVEEPPVVEEKEATVATTEPPLPAEKLEGEEKEETKSGVAGEQVTVEEAVTEAEPPPSPEKKVPAAPRRANGGFTVPVTEKSSYDLVKKMPHLFVRIVRARSLPKQSKPQVRISSSGRQVSTNVGRKAAMFFEWEHTFAFSDEHASETSSSLEISVWDTELPEPLFLGGICFDTPDIPIRDPPDSPLATQWYRLEGGGGGGGGELMLATWIGTQADESYHQATKPDDVDLANGINTRSKVYVSPKLWYLRLTVIEAQDLTSSTSPVSVKVMLGMQSTRTRFAVSRTGSPSWSEDVILVAAEPFGNDQRVTITVETRPSKDHPTTVLGSSSIPLVAIERRVDDRQVASRWMSLTEEKSVYGGARLHVRACLDGGYHVSDEPAHAASDYRPSAKQLWGQQIGTVEVGIIGCKGLLPMKTAEGKGTTDAYVVAKYGPKWARTRTVPQTLDPAWNEQYTWPVYDPSTVLTVAVFDDGGKEGPSSPSPSRPMGRVRIRISSLENKRMYRNSYPLLMLLHTGVKKTGEVELAVRFSRSIPSVDLLQLYGHSLLPPMHHLRPIPPAQREPLRSVAARIVGLHLSRADPPLRKEVVSYMLESDAPPQRYSMRKVRTNWQRIVAAASWAVDVAKWVENITTWRNPTATVLAHGVMVLVICYPDLIVAAVALHVSAVGAWKYRTRPRGPAGQTCESTITPDATAEEIDEELDSVPSGKGQEVVRARYDRLRAAAGRVQAVLGDVAVHAERVQALVSWKDPRATGIFVVACFLVAVMLFVVPVKVVVVGLGVYYMRHPVFRRRLPPAVINFFRRLPSMSDRFL